MKIKTISLSVAVIMCLLGTFGFGYYRGYNDSSRTSAGFNISLDEAAYDSIEKGKSPKTERFLREIIDLHSSYLRSLETAPLNTVLNEIATANGGDTVKELQKADEIAKGLNSNQIPNVPTQPSSVPRKSASQP
jgi:hypothetical protein